VVIAAEDHGQGLFKVLDSLHDMFPELVGRNILT